MRLKPALFWCIFLGGTLALSGAVQAQDKPESAPSWFKPKIYIYQQPKVALSTEAAYRTVDPQIIQKLIDLLDEKNLGTEEKTEYPDDPVRTRENKSIAQIKVLETPEGIELKNRYTRLGIALSESLGWEKVKNIRVISEQNLKQRLTTVARWDHSPNVRATALIALALLKDENDLIYFQEALWSRNVGIRYATIEALLKWGKPQANDVLYELTQKDESPLIRVVAAQAMARLNDPRAIEILRSMLKDPDWFVRALAAKGLGEVGSWQDYDLLLDRINKEQYGNSNSNEFVLAEVSVSAIRLFPLKIAKQEADEEARKRARRGELPLPPKPKPIPSRDVLFELEPLIVKAPRLKIKQGEPVDSRVNYQLLRLLQESADLRVSLDMETRSPAYRDLNYLVTPNGIRLKARYTILGLLLTEGLAGAKDFQIIDELTRIARGERALKSENQTVKLFAMIALAHSHELFHLNVFQEALRSNLVSERFAAIEALSVWSQPDSASVLLGVSKLDPSPVLRIYAAQSALRLGEPLGKDALIIALNSDDWVVRAMAMRYLGEMGDERDYNRILAYFSRETKDIVQAEMCSALLRLHIKKVEKLEKENQNQ